MVYGLSSAGIGYNAVYDSCGNAIFGYDHNGHHRLTA